MYYAYVTSIKDLKKHSNADRLQCATIFGNNVIVDLTYSVGQKVVFFPVDGQLAEEFCERNNLVRKKDGAGGYLDPEKRNIRAISLRGEKSEGLVLPIDVLSPYTNVEELNDGDKISVLNGVEICKKYIPKTSPKTGRGRSYGGKAKKDDGINFLNFERHVETEQLAYNLNAFKPGDTCYITLKMHGTSARTMKTIKTHNEHPNWLKRLFGCKDKLVSEYAVVSGTRKVVLRDYDGGYYGDNAFRKKWNDFFAERLPKGVEVFYEIVGYLPDGKTIMPTANNGAIKDKAFKKMYGDTTVFSYGCEPGTCDIYVYRMTMTNEDGYVVEIPWEQVQLECERMGVKTVPQFDKFIYTTQEDLMERVERYYDGVDPIGKTHVREGVVIRIDNREKFEAYKHKNFSFKVLSGIAADTADVSAMSDDMLEEI